MEVVLIRIVIGVVFVASVVNGAHMTNEEEVHSRTKRATSPGSLIGNIVSDVGPGQEADLVLVMDRSKGMGKRWFYLQEKKLAQALLLQYAVIHPDYTRLAVLTFGDNVYRIIDHITKDQANNIKGEIFYTQPESEWDNVLYDDDESAKRTTNLKVAFEEAQLVFESSLRPNAAKIIIVLTDGNYNQEGDPNIVSSVLKDDLGVKIYSVALGPWAQNNFGNIRELATNQGYFGKYEEWDQLVRTNYSSVNEDTLPLSIAVPLDLCGGSCINGYCANNVYNGNSQCLCLAGYSSQNGVCTECARNDYKADNGNEECLPCPDGFETASNGSTDVQQCSCSDPQQCNPNALTNLGCDNNTCNTHQQCVELGDGNFRCDCLNGFSGANCSVNVDDCYLGSGSLCNHDGTRDCIDGVGDYTCVCIPGFMGKYCEVNIVECLTGICLNGATCTDGNNHFTCECAPGWEGDYCHELIPTTTPAPSKKKKVPTATLR